MIGRLEAAMDARVRSGSQPNSEKHEVRTMSDIAERVKKIVVEHLGVEPDKVTEAGELHRRSRRRQSSTPSNS